MMIVKGHDHDISDLFQFFFIFIFAWTCVFYLGQEAR